MLGVLGAKQMAGGIHLPEMWGQKVLGDQGTFWV